MKQSDLSEVQKLLKNHSGIWNREWSKECVRNAFRSASYSLVYTYEEELSACFFAFKLKKKIFLSGFTIGRDDLRSKITEEMIEYYCNTFLEEGFELLIADLIPNEIEFYKKNGWFKPHKTPLKAGLQDLLQK